MSRDRAEPTALGDALGTTDPTWRDQPGAPAAAGPADDDAERTIDGDPTEVAGDGDGEVAGDSERTIDVDIDVLEHVRAAVRAARDGLAAPPTPDADPAQSVEPGPDAPTEDAPPDTSDVDSDPAVGTERPAAGGIDLSLPPPPAGVANVLPPPDRPGALPPPSGRPGLAAAAAIAAVTEPAPVAPAEPDPVAAPSPPVATTAPPAADGGTTAAPSAGSGGGRWQPPARLRPAEVRTSAPLVTDRSPARRHLDWRWAAVGIVVAAVVGFLVAIAVSGGDDAPDPAPGATTAPSATTIESTP